MGSQTIYPAFTCKELSKANFLRREHGGWQARGIPQTSVSDPNLCKQELEVCRLWESWDLELDMTPEQLFAKDMLAVIRGGKCSWASRKSADWQRMPPRQGSLGEAQQDGAETGTADICGSFDRPARTARVL